MRYQSPLRYPGGKASFAGLLEDILDLNDLRGASYYEPFAGGAGAALELLHRGAVKSVYLNDLDARVFAFWRAAINQTNQMIDRIMSVPLNIEEWTKQRLICLSPSKHAQIEVGFAAFYLNRCNRSGVLTGAGPIGGLSQSGKWRLDVRFYRAELAARLAAIGRNRDRIFVSRLDAIDFLTAILPKGGDRKSSFVYLDPPYVVKGQRLYLNAYDASDHARLARYVCKQQTLPWLMSYDDTPMIRQLYATKALSSLRIDYKLQSKRSADELVIAPNSLIIPTMCRIGGEDRKLMKIA